MTTRPWTKIVTIGGLALVFVWITYPIKERDISLDSCEPTGVIAKIRKGIYPSLFWQFQRQALVSELVRRRNWPKVRDQIMRSQDEVLAGVRENMEEMYQQYPELRPRPPTQIEQLRHLGPSQ